MNKAQTTWAWSNILFQIQQCRNWVPRRHSFSIPVSWRSSLSWFRRKKNPLPSWHWVASRGRAPWLRVTFMRGLSAPQVTQQEKLWPSRSNAKRSCVARLFEKTRQTNYSHKTLYPLWGNPIRLTRQRLYRPQRLKCVYPPLIWRGEKSRASSSKLILIFGSCTTLSWC